MIIDGTRRPRYEAVSTALAKLGDDRLAALVQGGEPIGSGIGGSTRRLSIEDTPVFVKQIALTDLERRPGNAGSTANLFGLPTFYQYGLGSAGYGAWRELAAHALTTDWVLAGRAENFPLLYHWRVLPGAPPPQPADEIAAAVAFWDGSAAVGQRLEAIAAASASVVTFAENVPDTVHDWLIAQAARGGAALAAAVGLVERELSLAATVMSANGFVHFDAHLRNILTDGRRLYVGDLGLASSTGFDLAPAELAFLHDHAGHDAGYLMTELVNWLVPAPDWAARIVLLRRYADGAEPVEVAAPVRAVVRRHASTAVIMNEFYWQLRHDSRHTPFPADQLGRAGAAPA